MSNPIVRMPAATARSEPIAKLFVFKKIAQSARDGRSHLCAHGYTLAGVGRKSVTRYHLAVPVRWRRLHDHSDPAVTDYGELWREPLFPLRATT